MIASKSEIRETIELLKRRSQTVMNGLYKKFEEHGLCSDELNELHSAENNVEMYETISKKYQ